MLHSASLEGALGVAVTAAGFRLEGSQLHSCLVSVVCGPRSLLSELEETFKGRWVKCAPGLSRPITARRSLRSPDGQHDSWTLFWDKEDVR